MILSIHQPHFFPWLGYYHKIANSDIFVLLDHVQFEKNYFQNRTLIKNINCKSFWLGVPVQKAPLSTPINEIQIAPVFKPKSMVSTIKQFYSKAPFFKKYFQDISNLILSDNKSLFEINHKTLLYTLDLLDIKTKLFISSKMNLIEENPNKRLVEICKKTSIDTYLSGKGGRKYMDLEMFEKNNINVKWQEFNPELIKYPQINGDFLPGLSILDALFNIGHEEASSIVKAH